MMLLTLFLLIFVDAFDDAVGMDMFVVTASIGDVAPIDDVVIVAFIHVADILILYSCAGLHLLTYPLIAVFNDIFALLLLEEIKIGRCQLRLIVAQGWRN